MTSVRKFLVGVLTCVYRPPAKIPLEEWAEANIWLGQKESLDNPGPYRKIHSVYAPRLLDEFANSAEWRTLVVMKSSQSGLTVNVLVWICRRIAEMFTSVIYVIDSKPKVTDISENRLGPMLRTCKALHANARKAMDKAKTLVMNLPNAIIRLGGAGSAGQLASHPADIVVGDELDKWKTAKGETHGWFLLIQRIKKAEHGKAVGFSTPTTEDGATSQCFEAGSKHMYFVPCPECGHGQVIDIDQMRFSHCKSEAGIYDFQRVMRETYMECEACKGRIEEDQKPDMLLAGKWKATNFVEIEVEGVKQQVPGWAPGEMSAHISDFYSIHPKSSWGILVYEFLRAQGNPLKLHDWTNGRAGRPVKKTVAEIGMAHILRLRGSYRKGSLPVMPCIVTIAVDNQGDHQKWVRVGWLPNGTCFVVDWGRTIDRKEIKWICEIPIAVKDDSRTLVAQAGIMDEGGKDGTSWEVRKFCKPLFPFFIPCKGRGGIQVRNTVVWTESKLSRGGEETIPVIHFDDDAFKRQLYIDLIKKADPQKARDFDLPRLWFPVDIDEDFTREMCGEELVKEVDANGVPAYVWKPKPPNDFGDCIKMSLVLWNEIAHKFRPKV